MPSSTLHMFWTARKTSFVCRAAHVGGISVEVGWHSTATLDSGISRWNHGGLPEVILKLNAGCKKHYLTRILLQVWTTEAR